MRDLVLGPQPAHQRDGFLQPRHALGHLDVERLELDVAVAQDDAQHVMSAARHIQGHRFLGHAHRIEQRQDQDVGTDQHALRFRQQVGHRAVDLQHLQWRGEAMVRKPQRGKAAVARQPNLFDQLRDARDDIVARRVLGVEKQPDLHTRLPLGNPKAAIGVLDWRRGP